MMNSKIDKIMQERQLASQAMERILELCVGLSERDAYDLLTLIQAEIQQVKSYYQPEPKKYQFMKVEKPIKGYLSSEYINKIRSQI